MDKLERDDFVHALTQTMGFYGKELEKMQVSFWVDACRDRPVIKLKKALREHVKTGRYAPRPAEILAIVDDMSKASQARAALPPPPETNCPPEIAKAWMWFNSRLVSGTLLDGLFSSAGKVDVETQEKYLHIVNHEAHKYGMPEAIPDDYKLPEVWG